MDELRDTPGAIDLRGPEFRRLGHALVDAIADHLDGLADLPVSRGEDPAGLRALLGDGSLPRDGDEPDRLLDDAAKLLFEHSLFTGHPRFFGYIVGAPAPIGALADLLAATVNPNLGGYTLGPIAAEIERQTVRWIAELVGYTPDAGGLLVTGGNMANFVGLLAARRAMAPWNVRERGTGEGRLRVYCSSETHTWIQKAADMFGLGTDSVRWIATDGDRRLDVGALARQVADDRGAGDVPMLVVGAAGTVGTGAIDPLDELAAFCREQRIWFHVDGAYGAFAAALPDAPRELRALAEADSVALDPHKWLYAPVEAGCALVRDRNALLDTFSYRPPYYHLAAGDADERINYFELGPQNSRSFRALKVWLALRQVGRDGYVRMLGEDCALARELHRIVAETPELEAATSSLSITTFRYVPDDAAGDEEYLNALNAELLNRLDADGGAFLSNAVVDGRFLLRACIVNFRTTAADIRAVPDIVRRVGAEAHAALRRPG